MPFVIVDFGSQSNAVLEPSRRTCCRNSLKILA